MFTKILLMKINVCGFVVPEECEEYAGETYMNRPIVSLKQVEDDENKIILVSHDVSETIFNSIKNAVYWEESLELNSELRHKKIIIYGTGGGAKRICKKLEDIGNCEYIFCLSKLEGSREFQGRRVIEACELEQYEDYVVVISVVTPEFLMQILEVLNEKGFLGTIYLEVSLLHCKHAHTITLPQRLNMAIKEHKKVYLYGQKNDLAELIEDACKLYGIYIEGYVYEVRDKEHDIDSIYEISYNGVEDKLIIIADFIRYQSVVLARKNIELAGFSLEQWNYTCIRGYTLTDKFKLLESRIHLDSLVGYSALYLKGLPGWKRYGKVDENSIRIMILGGSTSSEVLHPENWISKLHYKLLENNIKTTIYNGAHSGNDIVHEVLRLLRDGYVLKPHIVISMSGLNNINAKYDVVNQFNIPAYTTIIRYYSANEEYCTGLKSDEDLYSFWYRNVKLIKMICEYYGVEFFSFLQPMNITMNSKNLQEMSMYGQEQMEGVRSFSENANDSSDYVNIMRLFEHQDEMFVDNCHYTDKAMEVISDKVYETIMPTIKKLTHI
jgi:hypothetical protein